MVVEKILPSLERVASISMRVWEGEKHAVVDVTVESDRTRKHVFPVVRPDVYVITTFGAPPCAEYVVYSKEPLRVRVPVVLDGREATHVLEVITDEVLKQHHVRSEIQGNVSSVYYYVEDWTDAPEKVSFLGFYRGYAIRGTELRGHEPAGTLADVVEKVRATIGEPDDEVYRTVRARGKYPEILRVLYGKVFSEDLSDARAEYVDLVWGESVVKIFTLNGSLYVMDEKKGPAVPVKNVFGEEVMEQEYFEATLYKYKK